MFKLQRFARVFDDACADLTARAHESALGPWRREKPTAKQLAENDYHTGRWAWHGMPVAIENPANTVREGRDPSGRPWRNIIAAHYGYFVGTTGADGDPVDVFIGPAPESGRAWVINQLDERGRFDEHKVLVGFLSPNEAISAYRASYTSGWDRFDPEFTEVSAAELRLWLRDGDTSRPFNPDSTPRTVMDKINHPTQPRRVFWTADAMPGAGRSIADVLYELATLDSAAGLLLDPLTMAEAVEGLEVLALDALVVEVGRLKPKMESMMRLMTAAGGEVRPVGVEFSDPVRRFGGAHVAVIYELSDGQSITVWFHNPDATPAKLTPADSLVSWRWQLNKLDVTAVVAPEKGADLNVRDVARRVMRLAERNSARFLKANARAADRKALIEGLKTELSEKQGILAELNQQIDAAKVARDERVAAAAEAAAAEAAKTDEDRAREANIAIANEQFTFADASDDFKAFAGMIFQEHPNWGPLNTAMAMEKMAVSLDAAIRWDWPEGDAEPVGVIVDGGEAVGYIDMGSDGKAMVFTDAGMRRRLEFTSKFDGRVAEYGWSDDDAPEMVETAVLKARGQYGAPAGEPGAEAGASQDGIRTVRLPLTVTKAQAFVLFLVNGLKSAFRRKQAMAVGGMDADLFDATVTSMKRNGLLSTNGGMSPLGESMVLRIKSLAYPDEEPRSVMSDRVYNQFRGYFGEPSAPSYGVKPVVRFTDASDDAPAIDPGDDGDGMSPAAGDPPPDVLAMPEGTYAEWENKLTTLVEFRLGVDRSDAQGMVEAQDMLNGRGSLQAMFDRGVTAEGAYAELFADGGPGDEPAQEDPNVAVLRAIAGGEHDSEGLGGLYSRISAAVQALGEELTGPAAEAADAAISHWAELEASAPVEA